MTSLISTNHLTPRSCRITRNIARTGAVFSAAMLVLSVVTALGSGGHATVAAHSTTRSTSVNRSASVDTVLDTLPDDTVPDGTIPATTSTTVPVSTTTSAPTTIPAETTTTVVAVLTPTTEPPVGSGAPTPRLPTTGSASLPIAIWAILLLAFGRMTILFARPLKVLPLEMR